MHVQKITFEILEFCDDSGEDCVIEACDQYLDIMDLEDRKGVRFSRSDLAGFLPILQNWVDKGTIVVES